MIDNIWTAVEFLASIIECCLITHYISNFLEFKSNENKSKKKILFFLLTAFNNIILSQFLQIDAVIGIIQLIIALVFSFFFMKDSYFKKIFASFTSIFLILVINSGVLFTFSKILNEDIQVLISSIGIFRLLILFITKFLYYILTLILIKIFRKDEYKLAKEDIIYILVIFFITLIVGNLMFEYALKNNNNFSMLFNIIFVFLVTTNILSYFLLRHIKSNTNNEKDNTVKQAGGFIIQLMPFTSDEVIDRLEAKLSNVKSVTALLDAGMTPEQILEELLGEFGVEINEKIPTGYQCDCSRERIEKALISLGKKELEDMIHDGETIEVGCQFCNKKYPVTVEELKSLLARSRR